MIITLETFFNKQIRLYVFKGEFSASIFIANCIFFFYNNQLPLNLPSSKCVWNLKTWKSDPEPSLTNTKLDDPAVLCHFSFFFFLSIMA